jgi:hypothetical protein
MLQIVLTLIFGAIGWGVTHLLFEPMVAIIDLRRRAAEHLIVYGDLAKDASSAERHRAGDFFVGVGAGLEAHHYAAYVWVRWLCRLLEWDIHSAGERLILIGRGIGFGDISNINTMAEVALIRQSLRLPEPTLSPLGRALEDHMNRPV